MILLAAREIARQFDREPVFQEISFEIRPGERIGLVGPNGAGKTTLLHVLAGLDEPDRGEIERHPSLSLGVLEQEADFPPERTLIDEARCGLAHLYRLQEESVQLAETLAAESDAEKLERHHRRYDELQTELHRLKAYNIEHRVDEVLTGLGFRAADYDRPLRQFSGGQQSRALLASLLLRAPELLLLDEPTNHLDIEATEWLESHLVESDRAMILVSHDRYFLDRVAERIFELHRGTVTDYRGNFSAYWMQRAERVKVLQRTYEKQEEFVARTEDFIRRNKAGQKHAQAVDREKKLERLERIAPVSEIVAPAFGFGKVTRTGDWVIDAIDVTKGFQSPLFRNFTLRIERGDRIGIFGPNGSGKTTLLRTLLGELPPDSGLVRLGAHVKFGYYDQQLQSLDPQQDAITAIRPADKPDMTPATARSLLARFGIKGDVAFQQIGSLSGGEKSKVALARLSAQDANLLVLDEPTNHLDLWARDSLERALDAFEGTLLFVSHDRYFLDRVARKVIVLEPERWRYYEGNYSDYVQVVRNQGVSAQPAASARSAADEGREPTAASPPSRDSNAQKPKRKRQYPYRKVEELELEISQKEERLQTVEADLASTQVQRDGERMKSALDAYQTLKGELEQLYRHWEEAVELN